jgi:hypothetical protein
MRLHSLHKQQTATEWSLEQLRTNERRVKKLSNGGEEETRKNSIGRSSANRNGRPAGFGRVTAMRSRSATKGGGDISSAATSPSGAAADAAAPAGISTSGAIGTKGCVGVAGK